MKVSTDSGTMVAVQRRMTSGGHAAGWGLKRLPNSALGVGGSNFPGCDMAMGYDGYDFYPGMKCHNYVGKIPRIWWYEYHFCLVIFQNMLMRNSICGTAPQLKKTREAFLINPGLFPSWILE